MSKSRIQGLEIAIAELDRTIFKDASLLLFLPERVKGGSFIFTKVTYLDRFLFKTEEEGVRITVSWKHVSKIYDLGELYASRGKDGLSSLFESKGIVEFSTADGDPISKTVFDLSEAKDHHVLMVEFNNQEKVKIERNIKGVWKEIHILLP